MFSRQVYDVKIFNMGSMSIQNQQHRVFYFWLHNTDEMFKPSSETFKVYPSGRVTNEDRTSRSTICLLRFLGNIHNGGTKHPAALMQRTTVTFLPRSANDKAPTCFLPYFQVGELNSCYTFSIYIEDPFWWKLVLVNFRLHIISKNVSTFFLLKLQVLARDVDSGVRRES
jgi:hypothetical protein